MAAELKIKWEGTVPGVLEKRLSLSAFGEALAQLLNALRRIATNLVSNAIDEKRTGRFSKAARQLDIEISDLVKESTGFNSVISMRPFAGDSFQLFNSVMEPAAIQLLDAINDERQGVIRNSSVRKYLRSLPPGITRQTYQLRVENQILRDFSFGSMELSEVTPDIPSLREYVGEVTGVGFEPGKPEIRLKTEIENLVLSATSVQVEKALKMRRLPVSVLAVEQGGSRRLLILGRVGESVHRSTRQSAVFDRWSGLLRRLAQ